MSLSDSDGDAAPVRGAALAGCAARAVVTRCRRPIIAHVLFAPRPARPRWRGGWAVAACMRRAAAARVRSSARAFRRGGCPRYFSSPGISFSLSATTVKKFGSAGIPMGPLPGIGFCFGVECVAGVLPVRGPRGPCWGNFRMDAWIVVVGVCRSRRCLSSAAAASVCPRFPVPRPRFSGRCPGSARAEAAFSTSLRSPRRSCGSISGVPGSAVRRPVGVFGCSFVHGSRRRRIACGLLTFACAPGSYWRRVGSPIWRDGLGCRRPYRPPGALPCWPVRYGCLISWGSGVPARTGSRVD